MKTIAILTILNLFVWAAVGLAGEHAAVLAGSVLSQIDQETSAQRQSRIRGQILKWVKQNRDTVLSDYASLTDKQKDTVGAQVRDALSLVGARSFNYRLRQVAGSALLNGHLLLAVEHHRHPDQIYEWVLIDAKTGEHRFVAGKAFIVPMTDGSPALAEVENGTPTRFYYGTKKFRVTGQSPAASRTQYLFIEDENGQRYRSARVSDRFEPPAPIP